MAPSGLYARLCHAFLVKLYGTNACLIITQRFVCLTVIFHVGGHKVPITSLTIQGIDVIFSGRIEQSVGYVYVCVFFSVYGE